MARNFLINLSHGSTNLYLTDTGLAGGRRCRTETPGVAALFEPQSGNTSIAAGGYPFTEFPASAGGGRAFEIQIKNCPTSRFEDLRDLIDDLISDDAAAVVTFTGEPGSAIVNASPNFNPIPLEFDGFSNNNIRNVTVRFITSPNS